MQVKAQDYPHILVTAGLNGEHMLYEWFIDSISVYYQNILSIIDQWSLPLLMDYNDFTFLWGADPRVLYSEPAKFVAKLRDLKTDDNILLFKCELGAGHFSKSGR